MASQLKKGGIAWTDQTWNPIRGCSMAPGSETGGCLNCYAARVASRFSGEGGPFQEFARITPSGPRWTGKVELVERHILDPLKWKEPRRIFVNSMSDLFHEGLHYRDIDRVFEVMRRADWHTFQVLTKRAERMRDYEDYFQPLPNVWLGVSVEDQKTADMRIPDLVNTSAAIRFISYEPALGPVELPLRGINWVIVGGESGPGARPFDIDWARSTVAQCKAAGVACFVKQLGARVVHDGKRVIKSDPKGDDMSEWPEDIRVREFPV